VLPIPNVIMKKYRPSGGGGGSQND